MNQKSTSLKMFALFLATLMLLFSATSCAKEEPKNGETGETGENGIKLTDFKIDTDCIYSGEESTVTATVKSESPKAATELKLFFGENSIGNFHDDGKNGDVTANDGTYTCRADIKAQNIEKSHQSTFCVKVNDVVKTSEETVYCFDEITDDDISQADDLIKELIEARRESEKQYIVKDSFISPEHVEDALKGFAERATKAKDSGKAVICDKKKDYVRIVSGGGITFLYSPSVEGEFGSAESTVKSQPVGKNRGAVYYYGDTHIAMPNIDNTFKGFGFGNKPFTLEEIKQIPNNSVVMWGVHGNTDGYLLTLTYATVSQMHKEYTSDSYCFNVPTGIAPEQNEKGMPVNYQVVISPRFVTKYFPSLANNYMFLSTCHSFESEDLISALQGKGAEFVLGFVNEISGSYSDPFFANILNTLFSVDKQFNYNTLEYALKKAIDEVGENDKICAGKKKDFGTPKWTATNKDMRANQTALLNITVKDKNDKPLEASVSFVNGKGSTVTYKTDKAGKFENARIGKGGKYEVKIIQDDGTINTQTITVEDNTKVDYQIVILERWRTAYADFLTASENSYFDGFALAYFTNDDIPELVVIHKKHQMPNFVDVYTFLDGKVRRCTPILSSTDLPQVEWNRYLYSERGNTLILKGYRDNLECFKFDASGTYRCYAEFFDQNNKFSIIEYDPQKSASDYEYVYRKVFVEKPQEVSESQYLKKKKEYGIEDISKFKEFKETDFSSVNNSNIYKILKVMPN